MHYGETIRVDVEVDLVDGRAVLVDRFRGELYCGYGEKDPYTPPELIKELDDLLAPCEVDYSYLIHEGAHHGYALPDRDIFDKQAANRDWERIFAMFRRQIPPPTAKGEPA